MTPWAAFLRPAKKGAQFVAIDTEFHGASAPIGRSSASCRWAGPEEAVAIDALAEGIDLKPLLALMSDAQTLKVFPRRPARDLEIFLPAFGRGAAPRLRHAGGGDGVRLFGDSVSYETLVKRLAGG